MADGWFDPRAIGARVGGQVRGGGGGGGGGDFEDFLDKFGAQTEDGGKRATTFKPGQTPEEMPALPRRLATYAHGYSYSQGAYPGGVPRYFDGDETLPARLAPHNIAALQRMLVESGLLSNPRWGFWDTASEEAYQRALSESNLKGTDVQTLLTTYAEAAAIGEQETRPPFVAPALELRTTNKADLNRVFRQAVTEMLGVGWTDKQIAELVDAYGWEEIRVQADAYQQMVARERQLYETGTSDIKQINQVSAPSPETFIEQEARRRDLGGFQATQVAEDYAPAFFDALGGYT